MAWHVAWTSIGGDVSGDLADSKQAIYPLDWIRADGDAGAIIQPTIQHMKQELRHEFNNDQNLHCDWFASAANLSGCARETSREFDDSKQFQPLESLSESQKQQRDLAIAAKEELFQSLLGELMASIRKNGVPKSIKICKIRAPELAEEVSDKSKLRIGRTSFQLRNPENTPPSWATSFVEERIDTEVNIELDDNSLGVLLPIHLKDTCLMCHGSKESIIPEVAKEIRGLYPRDKATGFTAGDLRGYFWIEVPNQVNQ